MNPEPKPKTAYKALFISDVHMGTSMAQSERLDQFLKGVRVERLYLVGDFVDIAAMRRKFDWSTDDSAVVRRILKMSRKGVKVVYVPGNHDAAIRDFHNLDFSGIQIKRSAIHVTAEGKRLLVIHGDEFDGVLSEKLSFLYSLGDHCYEIAIHLSWLLTPVLRRFGFRQSLSYYLKQKVKNVMSFLSNFEMLLVKKAQMNKVDGVVCGHVHTAALKTIEGILYANCGCWTEVCTAIAEKTDGSLKLITLDPHAADILDSTGDTETS